MVFVAVLMGSESDWPVMQSTTDVLKDLGINFEVRVTSAHRTPAATSAYADAEGQKVTGFLFVRRVWRRIWQSSWLVRNDR